MAVLNKLIKIFILSNLIIGNATANDFLSEFAGEIQMPSGISFGGGMFGDAVIDINHLHAQTQNELEMKNLMESFELSIKYSGLDATLKTYQLDRPENYEVSNKILSRYMRTEALKIVDDNFEESKRVLLEKNLAPTNLDSLEKLKQIRNENATDNSAFIAAVKSNFSYDNEFESAIYSDSIMLVNDFDERRKFILNMAEIGTDQNAIGSIIHEYIMVEAFSGESDDELIKRLGRSYDFETVLNTDNIMCQLISDVDDTYEDSADMGEIQKKKAQKMLERLFEVGASPHSTCVDGFSVLEHMKEKGYSIENLSDTQADKPCAFLAGDASVTELCDMTHIVYDIVKRMSDNERLNGNNKPNGHTGVYIASDEECNYSLFDRFYIDDNGIFKRSMKVKVGHKQIKDAVLIEGNDKEALIQNLKELVKQ